MTRKIIYCTLLLALASVAAQAQWTDSTHYYIQLSSTNSINRASDKSAYLFNNGLRFSIRKEYISLNLNNNWLYGKQDGTTTNNDYSATLDANFYRSGRRFFYWGLANYNTSLSLNIKNQLLAGAGVAYSFFDNETAYLNLSDGFLFDTSSILVDNRHVDYQTIRNSFRLAYKFVIKSLVVLQGSNFYQPSLRDGKDFNIRLNNDITFQLSRWLNLKAALVYNRVNRTRSENLLFTYGLSFERYF
ncbi:Protein of unknown function, DUF481 [Parapedobacter composti]|uniref:DUF481 domain-containing protein n=1 Tax=Parapedobacter composti TaxID=623281 RepID=A0A1I1KGF7_9SPHI|nr:DUF481 domain-containing protein [Parapedobacter composti]SFC57193.1 Protein of unknown function, DUF481 [Parapedobacter composti]